MGCKGALDARIEAIETSRRALSDYVVKNIQKRNFSKMGAPFVYPNKLKKSSENLQTIKKNKKTKDQKVSNMIRTQKLGPGNYLILTARPPPPPQLR